MVMGREFYLLYYNTKCQRTESIADNAATTAPNSPAGRNNVLPSHEHTFAIQKSSYWMKLLLL